MTDPLADPFDRDHGPCVATPAWVVAALVGLVLAAMALDVVRAAGVSLGRAARRGQPLGLVEVRPQTLRR